MTNEQNYVSTELTHFVGGKISGGSVSQTREKQYELLLKILREGWITCKQRATNFASCILVDPSANLSSNRMVRLDAVCFCDIPLQAGLAIHMEKYSPFGLAFAKSFVVEQGANPVFYIANNSMVRLWSFGKDKATTHFETRAENFDKHFSEFYDCTQKVKGFLWKNTKETSEAKSLLTRLENVERFMSSLFGYFKCFDASKAEDEKENFYMEREWRLIGSLKFKISDVQRIILPKAFLSRFRVDFAEFAGNEEEITAEVTSIKRQ
jgi:hypothetical protein